jgi:hypothetical protein
MTTEDMMITLHPKNNKFIEILLLHRVRVFQYRRSIKNPKIEFLSHELGKLEQETQEM